MKIEVIYKGKIDSDLDRSIIKALKKIGIMFYADGYDLRKGVRDIAFDSVPYVPDKYKRPKRIK